MTGVVFRPRDAKRIVKVVRDAYTQKRQLKDTDKQFHRREIIVGTAQSTISASGGSGNVVAFDEQLTARTSDAATQVVYNPYGADVDSGAICVAMRDLWGIWWIVSADCP